MFVMSMAFEKKMIFSVDNNDKVNDVIQSNIGPAISNNLIIFAIT